MDEYINHIFFWLVVWNITVVFPFSWEYSSFQLTFIFFRGVGHHFGDLNPIRLSCLFAESHAIPIHSQWYTKSYILLGILLVTSSNSASAGGWSTDRSVGLSVGERGELTTSVQHFFCVASKKLVSSWDFMVVSW